MKCQINNRQRKAPIGLLVAFLVVANEYVQADSCGVMKLLENKSTAITINQNTCQERGNLALGSVITMQPGSRLWLKSNPEALSESSFQLICQNMSGDVVDAGVYGILPPWFQVSGGLNCSGWVDNKLNCADASDSKKNFFCALAYEGYEDQKQNAYQRSSSVKIRSIDQNKLGRGEKEAEQHRYKAYVEVIKRDVDLCKQVNQIDKPLKLVWRVALKGLQQQVDILYPLDRQGKFFGCVEAVLRSFPYALHNESLTFEARL